MILLAVGVPAVAITGLALAICATSGRCSRKEEQELDLLCYGAVEGALQDFKPETQSSSRL
ncbi:hypothetical protein IB244_31120 [Rhizobium sp. RHZ02]|uniref:hypothetical protein n=1 Tax=Rhizobium sp. RHZ02 TaxID=2769306 RepID=UPI00178769FA|nr:hypothetical protein [Rhizobium sp. RHZ02]MBD9455924.1 hypothetical protein [Rhizobium sp. RHZ02]